jgi:citrate lyase subunit beta / citryl-CoA lyase
MADMKVRPLLLRSLLFAPANEPRKTAKLSASGADAVVLDLEDAVARDQKIAARAIARAALRGISGPLRCIRVNAFDTGLTAGDVAAVACADLDAVVLPKAEAAVDLRRLDAILDAAETAEGLTHGAIRVIPLVETCVGIAAGGDIARASPRIMALAFGSGDLGRDLALPTIRGDLSAALAYGRGKIVYDARAAGLPAPLDGPYLRIRDPIGMEQDCRVAAAMGHGGKVCVHPDQVAIANRVFAPAPDEVAFAQRVIDAFAAAEAAGSAAIAVEGVFVDYPIVIKAHAIIALAAAIQHRQLA